jgi:hypothetical protein
MDENSILLHRLCVTSEAGRGVSVGTSGTTMGWAVTGVRGTRGCADTACCTGLIGFSSSEGYKLMTLLARSIARYMPFASVDVRPTALSEE